MLPLHPNPQVRASLGDVVDRCPDITVCAPMAYPQFVSLLSAADLLVTDSGGIQEEAPSLDKPILVVRESTERPEAVEAGTARLVGTDPDLLVTEALRLLHDPVAYRSMARIPNPFGDGTAGLRCAEAIAEFAGRRCGGGGGLMSLFRPVRRGARPTALVPHRARDLADALIHHGDLEEAGRALGASYADDGEGLDVCLAESRRHLPGGQRRARRPGAVAAGVPGLGGGDAAALQQPRLRGPAHRPAEHPARAVAGGGALPRGRRRVAGGRRHRSQPHAGRDRPAAGARRPRRRLLPDGEGAAQGDRRRPAPPAPARVRAGGGA
ncbi:UDP-N-acetylglucosamine 2-epimerase [Nocardioides convexus]|uniref:UDP-N-acetylglucosamine 2-epimerase n=1 Tax=Nocardioides convexus TaxID=2712224 RepID=UPI0024184A04|nr:UDP-N-acetylglucosamine 2-epimerase [Nocardioides convexus]